MGCTEEATKRAWYLLQCKVRQDARAQEHLERQGFNCYRPTIRVERVVRGRKQLVEDSLFPGYLFVQLGALDNWSPLRSTRGVNRVVSFGGQPQVVADELIEQLRQRRPVLPSAGIFLAGEKVRITSGPFAEIEGVFLTMDGEARVILLLNFLQRQQRVHLPLNGISKA